jgi:hypothetical protein
METFNHRYRAIARSDKWYILEDDSKRLTGPTDKASALWYTAMWNYWGSMYDRRNPKCNERLPGEMRRLWLAIMLEYHVPNDEDEDRVIGDDPQQPTLWQQ